MYRLTITREYFSDGTIGSMSYNGKEICKCIEASSFDRPASITCIPEGEYPVLIRRTKELGLHFWIADVPVRGHVLVCSANNTAEVQSRSIFPVKVLMKKAKAFSPEKP